MGGEPVAAGGGVRYVGEGRPGGAGAFKGIQALAAGDVAAVGEGDALLQGTRGRLRFRARLPFRKGLPVTEEHSTLTACCSVLIDRNGRVCAVLLYCRRSERIN